MVLSGFFFVRNLVFRLEELLERGVSPVPCGTTRCGLGFRGAFSPVCIRPYWIKARKEKKTQPLCRLCDE